MSLITDAQVHDLAIARTLKSRFADGVDPADLRVVEIVGRRWLRAGGGAHLAGYEARAVRRAALALEAREAASAVSAVT